MTDLTDWLTQIEALHPQAIDLELSRVMTVATKLGLTRFDCPVIVVGVTNGKGSCVTMLAAIYQQMGYRVGHYTSPHLFKFNERICINQQPMSDAQLVAAFAWIDQQRATISLTFFEFTTLVALWIFQQAADLSVLGKQIHWRQQSDQWELEWNQLRYRLPPSSLNAESVILAVTAALQLSARLPLTWAKVQHAVAHTTLAGRQQMCGAYLFDVAHNPAAAQRLSEWLASRHRAGRLYAVFSCCADKDIVGLLKPLLPWVDQWYLAPFVGKRSASPWQLQQAIATLTPHYTLGNDLLSIAQKAQARLTAVDQLLIFGSFHTVEQVYPMLTQDLSE